MSILQKNKKVAAGIGVAAVAAAAIALGAGTFAAFTDTETGPGGTLAAGTLDLQVGGAPGQATLLNVANIKPGQDIAPITLRVTNGGSIAGALSGFITITGADVVCTEPELAAEGGASCAANGNLQDQLQVTVSGTTVPGGSQTLPLPLVNNLAFPGGPLAANSTATYTVDFSLPNVTGGDVNNEVQGDSLTIATTLNLTQS